MKKKAKGISKWMILVLLLSFMHIGCTPARRPVPERDRIDINQERTEEVLPREENIHMGERTPNRRLSPEDASDLGYDDMTTDMNNRVENSIKKLPNVGDAVVIINNHTAYVGVVVNNEGNVNNIRALHANIANMVREMLPAIERVYITSDRNHVAELRNYREAIINGRPVKEMVHKIENIFQ